MRPGDTPMRVAPATVFKAGVIYLYAASIGFVQGFAMA